jgi:tRNA-2-methylthio-N6-dimethylallyladenosine synthase/ribosomal protein S12 methylthiotransferase
LGVFAFEPEEGTKAASMPGQVPDKVKRARKNAIMRAQSAISAGWLQQFQGQRLSVLVDAPHPDWPGLYAGRAWFQAPEIDGIVYISGPGVTSGALVEADIVETRAYDLVALT